MTKAARRGRPRAFDEDAVVGRAAETFWELGYEGASIAELTGAMGISAQSLYAAFGSKEQLYYRALDWYTDHAGSGPGTAMGAETDVVAAVRALLTRAAVDFRRQDLPAGCMVSTGALALPPEHRHVAAELTGRRARRLERLTGRLEAGVRDGQLRAELDAPEMARFLTAVLTGMAVQARDGASAAQLGAVVDMAMDQLTRYRA